MTDLHIALLSATATAQDEPRVRRLLAGVAEHQLEAALAQVELPPGEWCIRRLDVPLRLPGRQADRTVELAWARTLTEALRELLSVAVAADGTANVVHYPRPVAALADLLASLAAAGTERLWAWRQLGLLQPGDPDPASVPAAAALAALRRQPVQALPALVSAARTAGIGALHRLLGPAGWNDLARLVIASLGGDPALAIPPSPPRGPAAGGLLPALPLAAGRATGSAGAGLPVAVPQAARQLAAEIARRSVLGQAAVRSRLRPDEVTAWAWAALAAAEAEPALFARPAVRLVLAELAGSYPAAQSGGRATGAIPERRAAVRAAESTDLDEVLPAGCELPAGQRPVVTGDPAVPAGPDESISTDQTSDTIEPANLAAGTEAEQAAAESGWPTPWGGLPFFLNTAAQAGLPDALLADQALAGRTLSWTLYQLGRRLVPGIDQADPALFALAGLVPAPEPLPEPTPVESDRLAGHAARWAAITAAQLTALQPRPARSQTAQLAFEVAARLAGRPGVVFGEPGWIEIHLAVQGVRLDVRRAGLDVDPGWLRWLGAVVSFVYE